MRESRRSEVRALAAALRLRACEYADQVRDRRAHLLVLELLELGRRREQALDQRRTARRRLRPFAEPLEKGADRNLEGAPQAVEHGGGDAVRPLLVFLDLLEGEVDHAAEPLLAHAPR